MGLGTLVNTGAILAGGTIGLLFKKLLLERYQETITKAIGFACMVMAIGSVMAAMLTVEIENANGSLQAVLGTQKTMMMIISLALGALLGEMLNLDEEMERFGAWLKKKSGSENDSQFINAFVTSSLTVCIGAMAIIGSLQDGIEHDPSTLYAKAILDFLIIMMMSASLGKGCLFSAIPVALLQGSVTLLASLIAPIMSEAALSNISLVGNVLILCVGVNLVWPKTIRVANVLPAVVIAVLFALF